MKNKKSLGQHWLKERNILEQIADLAVTPDAKLCVEIGPGLGTLTSSLLKRFERVVAIEFDSVLAANLPQSFPGKALTVVNEDILQFDFSQITEPYVVAGNIPYYITSPIILRLLEIIPQPARIVLLMQKEVAERATPVKNQNNLLSLTIENRAHAERGLTVTRDKFTPPPQVDSQVLVLTPHTPLYDDKIISLAKLGFISPRKKLASNLSRALQLPRADLTAALTALNLNPDARPADLSLSDWNDLYNNLVVLKLMKN